MSGQDRTEFSRRYFIRAASLIGSAGILASCTQDQEPTMEAEELEEIRAVGIFALTGALASDGTDGRNGAVLAVEELNSKWGGVLGHKIKWTEIDVGETTSEEITKAFQRAVEVEKAEVIFAVWHIAAGPEYDIIADAKIPYFHLHPNKVLFPAVYSENPDRYFSTFQAVPQETIYGSGFVKFLDDLIESGQWTPAEKTAAVLWSDDSYDRIIVEEFLAAAEKSGWTITDNQSFQFMQVTDWGPIFSRSRENPPAVIFTADWSSADDAAMAKYLTANPIPSLVHQQFGPSVPEYLELAGDAANGIIWSLNLGILPDERGDDFKRRYAERWDVQPGYGNASGAYDEVMLWAQAVGKAGTWKDVNRVVAALEDTIHRGINGCLTFSKERHWNLAYPDQTSDPTLGQPHLIFQIQNQQQKIISPSPYTSSAFQMPPWM